jgi:ATP-dependent Clp protease protease subunit
MRESLLRFMARNRGKGFVKAEAGADGKTVIYLYDFIAGTDEDAEWWGGVGPGNFARELAAANGGDVEIRVNSPGGSVFGGRAMAAAIAAHPGKVMVVVDGLAASAASFLVQGADRVELSEGAMFMIHNAWTIALGNADAMRAEAAVLDKIDGQIAQTYAKAAERRGVENMPDFPALMAAESWLTAEESIAAGLADAMAEGRKDKKAAVDWDMSAFANAPKAEAATEPAVSEPQTEPEPVTPVAEPDPEPEDFKDEIERRRRIADAHVLAAA